MRKQVIRAPITQEMRDAQSAFMRALWATGDNRGELAAVMRAAWERFKRRPDYDTLRGLLREAAQRNGYGK